jgi:hypothetical protein
VGVAVKVAAVYRARQPREGAGWWSVAPHRRGGNEKSRVVTPQQLLECAQPVVVWEREASPFTRAFVCHLDEPTRLFPFAVARSRAVFVTQTHENRPDH